MTTKLYRVIMPVSDINRAARYYKEIFEVAGKRVSNGRHYFDCGGTVLACFDPIADGDGVELPPNPDHVYFSVEDLNHTYERVKLAGSKSLDHEIRTQPWGERGFYAKDPFGNPICFVDEKTVFTGR